MYEKLAVEFTERQSWMLPDLSVQRKTTNGPQLKGTKFDILCYLLYNVYIINNK